MVLGYPPWPLTSPPALPISTLRSCRDEARRPEACCKGHIVVRVFTEFHQCMRSAGQAAEGLTVRMEQASNRGTDIGDLVLGESQEHRSELKDE